MKLSKVSVLVCGLFLVIIGFVFSFQSAHSVPKVPSARAIMISVDGLRPEFYLNDKYQMTTVQELMKKGAYAEGAVPVFPSVTYPNHTTLITGEFPAVHGVLSNTIFSWQKGPLPAWYWEYSHIKSPTILDAAQSHNMTTASIRWPVTLGGRANFLVPEIFGVKGYYEGSDWDLTVKYTDPVLMGEIQKNISQKGFTNAEETDQWASQASKFIWSQHKPNLMIVHLADVDHQEHAFGRDSKEIMEAVHEADQNIKTILENVDFVSTCVFIVGDHGFYNVSKSINPNVLFAKRGWIVLDEKNKIKSWRVIAHSSGGQAAIYTKDKNLVNEIKKLLFENQKLGYRLVDKENMNVLQIYPDAILTMAANDGFTISSSMAADVVTNATIKGQHGHMPDDPQLYTGFVVSGCGITPGQNLNVVSNLDVAPTIAKYLGFEYKTQKSNALKILRE